MNIRMAGWCWAGSRKVGELLTPPPPTVRLTVPKALLRGDSTSTRLTLLLGLTRSLLFVQPAVNSV